MWPSPNPAYTECFVQWAAHCSTFHFDSEPCLLMVHYKSPFSIYFLQFQVIYVHGFECFRLPFFFLFFWFPLDPALMFGWPVHTGLLYLPRFSFNFWCLGLNSVLRFMLWVCAVDSQLYTSMEALTMAVYIRSSLTSHYYILAFCNHILILNL